MYAKLGRTFVKAWPLAIAIAIIAGMAAASIPDSGGLINACYKRATGALRVIDPAKGQTCTDRETPLSWSQTGPQGEQGPPGSSVVARLRWTGDLPSGQSPTVISLGPWTQSGDALNEVIPGTITFSLNTLTGECNFAGASLDVRVPGWGDAEPPYIPGEAVHYPMPNYELDVGHPDLSKTIPILLHPLNNAGAQPYPLVVFEPGADTTRFLEVTVKPGSGNGCARITSLSLDVVEVR